MSAIVIIAKALGLIVFAVLLFTGFAAALDVDFAGVAQDTCAGRPLPGCFLTII